MTINQFCNDIDELLERSPNTTCVAENITELPEWCSLSFMGLLAMVDDRYGVALPPRAVLESTTITQLFETIRTLKAAATKAA